MSCQPPTTWLPLTRSEVTTVPAQVWSVDFSGTRTWSRPGSRDDRASPLWAAGVSISLFPGLVPSVHLALLTQMGALGTRETRARRDGGWQGPEPTAAATTLPDQTPRGLCLCPYTSLPRAKRGVDSSSLRPTASSPRPTASSPLPTGRSPFPTARSPRPKPTHSLHAHLTPSHSPIAPSHSLLT